MTFLVDVLSRRGIDSVICEAFAYSESIFFGISFLHYTPCSKFFKPQHGRNSANRASHYWQAGSHRLYDGQWLCFIRISRGQNEDSSSKKRRQLLFTAYETMISETRCLRQSFRPRAIDIQAPAGISLTESREGSHGNGKPFYHVGPTQPN